MLSRVAAVGKAFPREGRGTVLFAGEDSEPGGLRAGLAVPRKQRPREDPGGGATLQREANPATLPAVPAEVSARAVSRLVPTREPRAARNTTLERIEVSVEPGGRAPSLNLRPPPRIKAPARATCLFEECPEIRLMWFGNSLHHAMLIRGGWRSGPASNWLDRFPRINRRRAATPRFGPLEVGAIVGPVNRRLSGSRGDRRRRG